MADPVGSFDLIVIGGGPAGYVGAIRAAQLGMRVACVERDKLGGVCLNWGCIPTKALLAAAEFYHKLKHDSAQWGIHADNIRHDWTTVIGRSRNVSGNLNKGIAGLFKKNKITHIQGHARITSATPGTTGQVTVEIHDAPGQVAQTLTSKRVLVATGAQPRGLPGVEFDGDKIITSKEAMTLPTQPAKLLIVGSGAIGMEFACFYNAFGTKVTVIEMLDRVLPNEDAEVSAVVAKSFTKQGIELLTATKTLAVKKTDTGVELTVAPVSDPSKTQVLTADKVLIAIGVKGRYDGLFDEKLGLETFKDHLKVDKKTYQTNLPGVYAVGDVIGPPWLAHVASEEAVVAVELMAGKHAHAIDYDAIPGCTYCHPQVASIGLTEAKAKEQNIAVKVGKFPLLALGKAQALGSTEGFVKLITGARHGEILGVHMVGENVTDLLAEMGLAMKLEATTEEIIATMHAHPTMSEAIHEAALSSEGKMIHF